MDTAITGLQAQFGPDPIEWQYGNVHHAHFLHPLQALTEQNLNIGPLPRGGASNTLNANRGNDRQLGGATFRIIADTSDWDATVATNAPGQSGNPASKHYADLAEDWNRGEFFPLYYSREKIEAVISETLTLNP